MKRQIRNAITSFVVTAFAGIGLMAFGQSPCPCPCPTQTVQPVAQQPVVIQQPVEQTAQQPVVQTSGQTCQQPVAVQVVEEFIAQPAVQPTVCAAQTTGCEDLCDLTKRIEKHADHLRSEFKDSVKCLDCVDDSYYDSVKEFERATDRLKKNFRRGDCNSCDITADVQEVLALANCISAYMDPCSHCPEVISEWTELQADLQQLAGQFCTTAAFQQPVSLACPVPACVQPVQPAVFVQPTCPQPAPVVTEPTQEPAPVIYK